MRRAVIAAGAMTTAACALVACTALVDTRGLSGGSRSDAGEGGTLPMDVPMADGGCAVACAPSTRCISSVCVPADGLVAWYGFEEIGAEIADLSGKGNHGSSHLATTTTGKVGAAVDLTPGSCVVVGDSPSLKMAGGQGLTMMAWVRFEACAQGSSAPAIILNKEDTYEFGVRCPALRLEEAMNTGSWSWRGGATLPLRTWKHVAITWDGALVHHYIDGVEAWSRGQTGNLAPQGTGLGIGCRDVGPDRSIASAREWFHGAIDEVAVYSRALSNTEVRAYYESTR
jgi:hypothetical protein